MMTTGAVDRSGLFSGVSRQRMAFGFITTCVIALSVHAVMLEVFRVPYPSEQITARLPDVLNHIVFAWGAMWLYDSLHLRLYRWSTAWRIAVLTVLLCTLNETLRGWLMNAYCADTSVSALVYFAVQEIPKIAAIAVTATGAVIASRRLSPGWQRGAGAVVLGLFLGFAVGPLLSWLQAVFSAAVAGLAPHGGWCQQPYGMNVLIPAYLTYAEPALACLLCMALVARRLPAHGPLRPLIFMLLILALKMQLLTTFFYAFYAAIPAKTALASMGQFSLETAILGVLTALSWDYATRPSR
ncbi:hypothetical protein CAL12_04565 [Bordetella genomosp. 8]|uniref:Uncharacterized protein n=1 Tax=Bordetella genomosp. 8 TaxID=1416806 RepID=A0A1W6YI04_9BORD|nr:hypothetical protein [Bordetella genomosp. 8]ARP80173.1 hypothetical protein CAL12_04565 [Bordetella genomosp. 8]